MSKREQWIDGVKGIAIILVVLGHALDGFIGEGVYGNYKHILEHVVTVINIFHMPLFMVVSGYLYSKVYLYEKSGTHLKNKIVNLILLYFEWSFIWYMFKTLSRGMTVSDIYKNDFVMIPIKSIGVYWYLYILIFLYFIMKKIVMITKGYKNGAFIVFVILSMIYLIPEIVLIGDTKFTIVRVLYYLMFFYYGYLLQIQNIKKSYFIENLGLVLLQSCLIFVWFWLFF